MPLLEDTCCMNQLQALIELGDHRTRLAVLGNHIVDIVVVVVNLTDGSGHGSRSALGSLVGLRKLLDRDRTALHLQTHVFGNSAWQICFEFLVRNYSRL